MNYTGIIQMIKDEVEKERAVVDDLAYKRGLQDAAKAIEDDEPFDEEDLEELFFDGYAEGMNGAFDLFRTLYDASPAWRYENFECISVEKIIEEYDPVDVIMSLLKNPPDKKKDEDKVVFTDSMPDEAVKIFSELIEYF